MNNSNAMSNDDLKKIRVGDKIQCGLTDRMIEEYLKEHVFRLLRVESLRLLCAIKETKFYEVVDTCHACKSVAIKIGDGQMPIRYHYIEDWKPRKK